MVPAYNKKRCSAFPFEMGIHFRRKTDFFPEEDTTKYYSGFEPTRGRLGQTIGYLVTIQSNMGGDSLKVFGVSRESRSTNSEYLVVSYRVLKMEVNKEKIRFFLGFFFDKGENASQVAEIANGVYGHDTVTANYVQFWFRRFRSGIFDVKDAPRTVRPVVENHRNN
ncbi:histone-lysine N-methyltransferase SETMAR [Trichonephila clavipes]|nr:histone-lysine N-methyltransferase SETMAR [Trichonephila clavipes]